MQTAQAFSRSLFQSCRLIIENLAAPEVCFFAPFATFPAACYGVLPARHVSSRTVNFWTKSSRT